MGKVILHAVISELTLDFFAASACSVTLGVAALNHKALNDSVEGKAVIELIVYKLLKVFNGNGSKVIVKVSLDCAAFGMVTKGMDVVDKIAESVPVTDGNGTVAKSNQPVIESIRLK